MLEIFQIADFVHFLHQKIHDTDEKIIFLFFCWFLFFISAFIRL